MFTFEFTPSVGFLGWDWTSRVDRSTSYHFVVVLWSCFGPSAAMQSLSQVEQLCERAYTSQVRTKRRDEACGRKRMRKWRSTRRAKQERMRRGRPCGR